MTYEEAIQFVHIANVIDPNLKVTIEEEDGDFFVRFRRTRTPDLAIAYGELSKIRGELLSKQLNMTALADRVLKDHLC